MATFDYQKGNDQGVVQQLNELFGDKLNLDVIKKVAKSCKFDVYQSSNELIEIANTEQVQYNVHRDMSPSESPVHSSRKSKKTLEIERVINLINQGYKVLILMRGLPGSGKSTLAKSILEKTIGFNNTADKKHILSTDDFFMKNGIYQYNKIQLPDAHGYNHQRAFSVMCKGFSPVIIDNTNTQMWEMKPYALMATDYGYILEILEPDTHWCFNEKELEKRNKHGVPKAVIKSMLERYEKNVTPMKLLTAYDCKYKLQKPPQYRLHPPLPQPTAQLNGVLKSISENKQQKPEKSTFSCVSQESTKETINFMDFFEPANSRSSTASKKLGANPFDSKTAQSSSVDDILMHSDPSFLKTPVLKPVHTTKIKQSSSLFDNINAWGVDAMALQSWDIVTPLKENEAEHLESIIIDDDEDDKVETKEISTNTDDSDFFMMRHILSFPPPKTVKVINTCSRDINRNTPMRPQKIRQKLMIEKSCLTEDFLDDHKINLDNLIRVFPNVDGNIIKYWYEKCNRDFDCTIELLLTEKEEIINVMVDDESDKETDTAEPIVIDSDSSSSSTSEYRATPTKHKRKNNSSSSDESHDLKKYIESKVTISDSHYSEKLLKIKQIKYREISSSKAPSEPDSPIMLNSPAELEPENDNKPYFDDLDWEDSPPNMDQDDNVETIELNLGDHFVKQLEDNFADPNLMYPKGFQPVVQMPVALARQLYTFYIESVYQQMEAQNSVMDALVKEDEEFARKLQEKEEQATNTLLNETKISTEPTEIPDIIKEQRELSRWQREADKWKQDTPDTLAARLTRDKLFNSFPSLDRNTLVEILHAHENVYKDTVETLLASTNMENVHGDMETIKEPPINAVTVKEMWEAHKSCEKHDEQDAACSAINYREEANQYLENRKNYREKAQRYYQSGMVEVAQFYSGLASKQTQLYEHANSLAATAFLDEHSKRLEDFNTLDLHFLYVKEAIPYLDIFLDRNINLLRSSTSRNAECLQIITGRGKHSKNGVAKIRAAVVTRLMERRIGYQLLNPGLLKVKVTNSSLVTSEL